MAGLSLTIEDGGLTGGTVGGGARGTGNGEAFGGGLFLQGDETVTLAPPSGRVERISGVIADATGRAERAPNAGAGSLILDAGDKLDLTADNTFTGGVMIEKGTLELANSAAGGSAYVRFPALTAHTGTIGDVSKGSTPTPPITDPNGSKYWIKPLAHIRGSCAGHRAGASNACPDRSRLIQSLFAWRSLIASMVCSFPWAPSVRRSMLCRATPIVPAC
jgi:autotransporter-associated beta strand protein